MIERYYFLWLVFGFLAAALALIVTGMIVIG